MTIDEFIQRFAAAHAAQPFSVQPCGRIRDAKGFSPICAVGRELGRVMPGKDGRDSSRAIGLQIGLTEDDLDVVSLAEDTRFQAASKRYEWAEQANEIRDRLLEAAGLTEAPRFAPEIAWVV